MLKKITIIDGHSLAYRLIHSAASSKDRDKSVDLFDFWRYLMFYNLFTIVEKFNSDRFIIVFDSPNSWRYGIYENYKQHRKALKEKYIFDYQEFKTKLNDLVETLRLNFTKFYILKVDKAEGDDIIAVISRHHKDCDITIISSDTDFIQLINENVKLYDPRAKKYIKSISPKNDLNIKILKGDEGDNIPPIKRGIGVVHATKIITSGLDEYIANLSACSKLEMLENYNRNKILISFDFIPKELQWAILNQYNEYNISNVNGKQLFNVFVKNKLVKLIPTINSKINRMNLLD